MGASSTRSGISTTNDEDDQYGLIILGNSGVGKSFLANILLGREAFVHEFSPGSVTHTTEYHETDLLYDNFTIFNIPGLIEAQQERIDLNKKEIDKAFEKRPNSIVIFVFGQVGGRIKEEDIVAFNAINAAYPFDPQSLVLVVNGLPEDRPSSYEGTTMVLLQQILKDTPVSHQNLCFLNNINRKDAKARQRLKEKLLQVIVEFRPAMHRKKQEILTRIDQLKESEKVIKEQRAQFDVDREKFMQKIDDGQRLLNEAIANHRTETDSLQRAIQRQEELYAEQQRQFEEESQRHQTQLQVLQQQVEESQRNHAQLLNGYAATQQQIQAASQAYQQLHAEYQRAINQPPPSRPKRRKSHKKSHRKRR